MNPNSYLAQMRAANLQMPPQNADNMQMQMPPQMQPQMPVMNNAAFYNPFDEGIKRAIASARNSLGPTKEQQDASLRGSLLSYGQALGNAPRERGFLGNLASGARALAPALESYDASNMQAEAQNNALAEQMLAHQYKQRAIEADEEEKLWRRDYRERELEERRQNHLFRNFMMRSGALGRGGSMGSREGLGGSDSEDGEYAYIEGMPFRKLDKIGLRHVEADKKEAAKSNHEIQELYKSWGNLEDKTKDNFFAPIGGWSGWTNFVKDGAGRYLGVQSLREETALRQDLESKLGQLTTALERTKTGRGLTQGMFDRLKDYYPNKNDNAETLKIKLKSAAEDADLFYEAARLSAEHGANVTIDDVKNLREIRNNQANMESMPAAMMPASADFSQMQNQTVKMRNPQSGKILAIPASEANEALADGLELIE